MNKSSFIRFPRVLPVTEAAYAGTLYSYLFQRRNRVVAVIIRPYVPGRIFFIKKNLMGGNLTMKTYKKLMDDIAMLRQHTFDKVSPLLGPVKATVTMMEAGTQHNVVPASCRFVVDVRSNECYSNAELLAEISGLLQSHVKARSTRLNSSRIHPDHPLVQRAIALGRVPYGSPTLSDQALMPWPSFKMGPGDSARSHTADEYITFAELQEAACAYPRCFEA